MCDNFDISRLIAVPGPDKSRFQTWKFGHTRRREELQMRLLDDLGARLASEDSYFRQHLIKEDIARLERLVAAFTPGTVAADLVATGLRLGWTPDDSRTNELRPALEPLLDAIHNRFAAATTGTAAFLAELDDRILALWNDFERLRMDRLVGCLARVPRPTM